MFVGYYLWNVTNLFCMLNKKIQSVRITTDVVWLNVTFTYWINKKYDKNIDLKVYELWISKLYSPIQEENLYIEIIMDEPENMN